MIQTDFFEHDRNLTAPQLAHYLNDRAGRAVQLCLTRNRVSMASIVFPQCGPVRVRLHEEYLRAPAPVIAALRAYVRTRRRDAWRTVAAYGETLHARRAPSPRDTLRTRGLVHDLAAVGKQVNKRFFNGRARYRIGWSRKGRTKRKRRRMLNFGSYRDSDRTILVNPVLDDPRVPGEFMAYIVFHEMLHSVVPSVLQGNRRIRHTAAFRTLERAFPDFERMQEIGNTLFATL